MIPFLRHESKIFTRVPGGRVAKVCGLFFLAMLVIAVVLHSLTIPVDPFMHFVSSMGIGPNGSAIALNVGLLALGIGLYPFILHTCQLLRMERPGRRAASNNRLVTLAFLLAMVCVPGLIVTAFFPMAPDTLLMHAIGAMLIFAGTIVFGSILWVSLEWHKESSPLLRTCSACVLASFACMQGAVIAVIVQYPGEFHSFLANPLAYAVQLIGNTTDTKLRWVRFFEWLYIIAIVIWSIVMGDRSVRFARRHGGKG